LRKPDTLRESVKRAKRIQEYGAKPLGMEVANELDDLAHKIGADEELFEELDKRYFVVEQLGKGNEREVAKFEEGQIFFCNDFYAQLVSHSSDGRSLVRATTAHEMIHIREKDKPSLFPYRQRKVETRCDREAVKYVPSEDLIAALEIKDQVVEERRLPKVPRYKSGRHPLLEQRKRNIRRAEKEQAEKGFAKD
jgi:hypothetical protein